MEYLSNQSTDMESGKKKAPPKKWLIDKEILTKIECGGAQISQEHDLNPA